MIKYIFALLAIVFLGLMLAGCDDYDEAVKSEQRYIERVCDGVHTDYEGLGVECVK